MKKFLEKYILFFFSIIIFGGLLWGIIGLGQLLKGNWDIVDLLFHSRPLIKGLIYIFIGICTLSKTTYNIFWDRPKYSPHINTIIFIVVASGLYWGIVGIGFIFNLNLNLVEIIPNANTTIIGIVNYTIGILSLIKLFNFIYNK